MKSVLKIVAMMFLATGAFASNSERDFNNFEYVDVTRIQVPNSLEGTIVAWDKSTSEFVWKNFAQEDAQWKVIEKSELDEYMREIKSEKDLVKYLNYNGAYIKMRKIGDDDVALSYELRMNGGGPITAAACGIVCKIIAGCGCGAGAVIMSGINIGLGVLYGAVCAALDTAGTAGCVTACLALPTP